MSLKDAVLDVAEQLEIYAKRFLDGDVDDLEMDITLRLLAAQLRGACKAAGPETIASHLVKNPASLEELTKRLQSDDLVSGELKKQAERKKQQEAEHASMMEKTGTSVIWCEGGPAHGTLIPAPSTIPIGATPIIMGAVYVMMGDGKLWWNEEETKKMQESLQSKRL